MKKKIKMTAAIATAFAALTVANVSVADVDMKNMEKCYGVSKAGQNDCKSANASHTCAALAKEDNNPNDWKALPKGECSKMKGSLTPPKA